MNADVTRALARIFLFEQLPEADLRAVASCAVPVHLQRGEHLYSEGDAAVAFFAVLEGRLKIYRLSPAGDEFIVHIQQAGDLVAEAAIFDLRRYPASCQALEDCDVLRIESGPYIELLARHPQMALRIMNAYSRRLRSFVTALEDLSLRDVKARVAGYLLREARPRDGEARAGELFCPVAIPKKELASLLGTIPETLSRTLRDLKQRGIVEESEGGFRVLDPAALRGFVKGE